MLRRSNKTKYKNGLDILNLPEKVYKFSFLNLKNKTHNEIIIIIIRIKKMFLSIWITMKETCMIEY